MNCHGCKWLDEVKHKPKGEGYCCMVERSKTYKRGDKVRYTHHERCELFKQGDFKTRYNEVGENARTRREVFGS